MFTISLYVLAFGLYAVSLHKDRPKTTMALRKSLKSFMKIFPDIAGVLALVGVMLTFVSPELVARFIGEETGAFGMAISSVVGSISLIPGFVAFPLADSLLDRGAGVMQIAVFVSTLMMVGVVTAPLEIKYFGKKMTVARNALSFLFSFLVAFVVGMVMK